MDRNLKEQCHRVILREIHINLTVIVSSSLYCNRKSQDQTYCRRHYAVIPRVGPVAQIEGGAPLDIIHHATEETYLPPFWLTRFCLSGLSRGLARQTFFFLRVMSDSGLARAEGWSTMTRGRLPWLLLRVCRRGSTIEARGRVGCERRTGLGLGLAGSHGY